MHSSGIPVSYTHLDVYKRQDYMQPMHDAKKDLSVFRPGLTPTGIAFQGQDIGQIFASDWNSFSPRLGFSYQPTTLRGFVIRGGGGPVSYTHLDCAAGCQF